MKLGVLTVPLYHMSPEEAFKYLSGLGVQTVEIGVGGFVGNTHLNPREFLADPGKVSAYKELLAKYNLEISALSAHANPVHPNKETAAKAHEDFIDACKIAQKFGLDTVVTFSGCPGDQPGAKYPNWVTCPWPDDFLEILKYQWNDVLVPYWKNAAREAAAYGVTKIALELHPGFCVYSTKTLLHLREEVGDAIGANFDPSHLFWQGMNPVEAIRSMQGAIYHFHAKDTKVNARNVEVNGVLDTDHYGKILDRSWIFRTVGYGHDYAVWKDIISTLRAVGYEGAISIEHEDGQMSVKEGLESAIKFLKNVILFEKPADMWWA
ncbi:MAG: sugar phosphate isomerase/epimerase [Oscillospiraceae bacterium]|jgi:sugar phosphate isomerase/epimerase|nr:sugar phosphate isomerase/epimerase [Oscillospiraceae bacterium]